MKTENFTRAVRKIMAPLVRRVLLVATRGRVLLTNDDNGFRLVQMGGLADEVLSEIEHLQEYGFTSRPHDDAEGILISFSGNRDHTVAIAIDDRRYRIKLEKGEVALYTDEGDKIHFKRGRIIEVVGGEKVQVDTKVAEVNAETSATVTSPIVKAVASTKVVLETPMVEMTQDAQIAGQLQVTGPIVGQGGLAISGGSGATVQGDVAVTSGDVTADGKSLKTHVHSGVQAGGDNSGPPV